jgi:hypothetical protein
MKTPIQLLIIAGLVAGASFGRAQTTNYTTNPVVYIAGSTAFSPLDNAALDSYAVANGYTLVATTASTAPAKAKALLYARTNSAVQSGKNFKATIDYINVHQTGSEDGVESASSGGTILKPFLDNNARGLGLADSSTNYPNSNAVVITTSPIYQKNSQFYVNSKLAGGKAKGLIEVTATNTAPGIAAQIWAWSVGTNFPTDALNISAETAQALFQSGNVPLSYFTGNRADATNGVWLIGRDAAAGARLAATITSGFGGLAQVHQYVVTNSGGVTALALSPAAVVLGISEPIGNGGYASASSQQAAATNILPANVQVDLSGTGNYTNSPYSGTNYLIQYNGYANSVGVTNKSGAPALLPLSYNGNAASTNGVVSGSYSFWTYEHLYITPTKAPANALAIAQGIASYIWGKSSQQLSAAAGPGYLNIQDLGVSRTTDGGPVVINH